MSLLVSLTLVPQALCADLPAGVVVWWGEAFVPRLKSDGTVVAWGRDQLGETAVPAGLRRVTAISADDLLSLALKSDGTVAAWGANFLGQRDVPVGLSNVVAIAAGASLCLALTTGSVPSSVFVPPHGRLEEMEREADLIFKGQAIGSTRITNAAFMNPQMDVHETKFRVVSVLKGRAQSNVVAFQHYTKPPGGWGGPHWPPFYHFEPGRAHLIFAASLDKPDKYYSVVPGQRSPPNAFRQLAGFPLSDDEGVTRTLDARPLSGLSIKDAHWLELNLLLNDTSPTNQLYAIEHLNASSRSCLGASWHSEDFKREAVLHALLPLVADTNDEVAVAAIDCFQLGGGTGARMPIQHGTMPLARGCDEVTPTCIAQVAPYAATLIALASGSPSTQRRVAAVAALSCTRFPAIRKALPHWLADPAEEVRSQAVLLLADFPGEFSQQALRDCAGDTSLKVRAAVADAIGNATIQALLPTLEDLFSAPVGATNPVPPLTLEELQSGGQLNENVGDVHTSAGYALLKFQPEQVKAFLESHLNDAGFKVSFLCKLAEKDAGPWLKDLAAVLEARRARNQKKAGASGIEPRASYFESLMVLSGEYFECWNIIDSFLRDLPGKEFAAGKMDRYLDVLENSGNTGSREPVMIYELYRMKRLHDRARKFCDRTETKFEAYNIRELFDRIDAQYANSPPK